jgi:hypothetical protein
MTYDEAANGSATWIDLRRPEDAEIWHRDALRFLVNVLGRDWLERELDGTRQGGYLLLDSPEQAADTVQPHLRTDRLMTLAMELHEVQDIGGFDHLVAELRTRSLFEAVAEMRAANHMLRAGQEAWFVDPNATAGRSYDAVVVLSGIEVAVEVKAKEPKPVADYRPRLIENSLDKARRQLPGSGPALIYLQVSSPWSDDADVMTSVDACIHQWLRKTRRINGVHVLVERTFTRPDGHAAVSRGGVFIPNLSARAPVPDIQAWLDGS